MSNGNCLAQCLVDIDLGLNHGISKRDSMDQCRRDRSTENSSCFMSMRRGNRSIANRQKILAHQTRHTTTFDEQCVGSTVQQALSRALHISLASDLASRKKSGLMKIGRQQCG